MTQAALTTRIFWISSVAFFFYLFMQELNIDKIHFFKFLCLSDKPRLHQLKIITSSHSTVQASLTAKIFSIVQGNTMKEGEMLYVENKYKAHQLTKHAKISYSIVSLVFCTFLYQTYRSGLNRGFWKLRYSKYLKKYESC